MCGPRRDRGCGRCAQRGAVHQQTLQRQGLALVRGGTTQLLPFSNILSAIGYNIWRLTARGLPHMFFMGYPLVGGRRQRHFARTNSKPRKLLKNAQTPTTCPGVSCRGSVHYPGALPGRCVGRLAYEKCAYVWKVQFEISWLAVAFNVFCSFKNTSHKFFVRSE